LPLAIDFVRKPTIVTDKKTGKPSLGEVSDLDVYKWWFVFGELAKKRIGSCPHKTSLIGNFLLNHFWFFQPNIVHLYCVLWIRCWQ